MLSTTLLLEVCVTFDQPDVGQVIRKYGYRYSRAVRAYTALNLMGAAMRVRGCISHTACDCHVLYILTVGHMHFATLTPNTLKLHLLLCFLDCIRNL